MSENKRYFWLKLKESFFDDDTIDFLESQENGKEYLIFYLKLCCKSLKDEGKLIRYVGNTLIPYDDVALAKLTRTNIDIVRSAIAIFYQFGLIEKLDTGELYLSQINEMIGSECDSAERVRKLRAKKQNVTEEMLPPSYNVTNKRYDVTEKGYNVQESNINVTQSLEKESRERVRERVRERDEDDRQTADSQNCEIGETSSSKYRFFTSEQLEEMGADIKDTATDLDSFGDFNAELKKSCKQKGITGFPTPKEVYVFYHVNKLPISPERFWELNNLKKWTDNNGQQIRHWENAYIQLCEWSNPDEEYNPALEFNSSNYDTYSGVIEGVGKEFC